MQVSEQLRRQLELNAKGGLQERLKQLEDEKNALLDYIEENIEKHSQSVLDPRGR